MQQAIGAEEIVEAILGEDGGQIDFEVRLAADEGRGAQQTYHWAVGGNAPQGIALVEVLLDKRMRRPAWAGRWVNCP